MEDEDMLEELAKLGRDLTAHDIRHLTRDQRSRLKDKMMTDLPTFENEDTAKIADEIHQNYKNEQRKKNEW